MDYRVRGPHRLRADLSVAGAGCGVAQEAAAVGTERTLQKMAHAVELSALVGRADLDWALGHAAVHGRFATGDLGSMLAARDLDLVRRGADEDTSLAQGTSGWTCLAAASSTGEAGIA